MFIRQFYNPTITKRKPERDEEGGIKTLSYGADLNTKQELQSLEHALGLLIA